MLPRKRLIYFVFLWQRYVARSFESRWPRIVRWRESTTIHNTKFILNWRPIRHSAPFTLSLSLFLSSRTGLSQKLKKVRPINIAYKNSCPFSLDAIGEANPR